MKILFVLFLLVSLKGFSQREVIDTLNFNDKLLNTLLTNKLNSIRKKKKVDSIYYDFRLTEMTLNHVVYLSERELIGHYQKLKDKQTVGDRLVYFGGNNQFVDENVLSIDLRRLIIKSKGRYNYNKLSKLISDKLKKSSSDYKEIINKEYFYTNQQFKIKNGYLYICQTLASKPFEKKYEYIEGESIFVKESKPCNNCKKVQKKINSGLGHVGWYSVSNDSIYYWNTKYYYKGKRRKNNLKMIFNRKGTIAIDVIHHEQISCEGKTAFDRSNYHDGYYMGFVSKNSLKKDINLSEDIIQIYIGQIPAFIDTFYQIDLNYSKKWKPCMNNSIIYVNPDYFKPSEYFDIPKPKVEQANQILIKDSLIISVPFKRSQTDENVKIFEPLIQALDSIINENHTVKTIFYTGIASIEGNESNNKKLIRKRGQLIKNYLLKSYPDIKFKSDFYENFDDFRDGLGLIGFPEIAKYDDKKLREWTNKHRNEVKVAELLNATRQSIVTISFHDEIKLENIKYTLSVKHVSDLIELNNPKKALIYFQIMAHKAIQGSESVKDSIAELNIPQDESFSKLNWNYFVYQLKINPKDVTEQQLNKLLKNGAIKNKVQFLEYKLLFNVFNESNAISTRDFGEVIVDVKQKKQKAWLETLDLISGVQTRRYSADMTAPMITQMALKNKFNAYKTYFVCQYLIDWGYTIEPYLLLSKFARQKNLFPKLYKQYIKLGFFLQQFNNKREWKKIKSAMKTLSTNYPVEFCDLFKWHQMGIRAIENKETAKIFCETCR